MKREKEESLNNLLKRQTQLSINDFKIIQSLGKGSFAEVKLVSYTKFKSHLPLALKIISRESIEETSTAESVRNEQLITDTISHPFIVKSFGNFQDSKNIYFLFEYLPGGDLFTQLKQNKRFSLSTTRFYASQILLAIRFLHFNDIIYRDLKLENILLNHRGSVKLIDFGTSKFIDEGRTFSLCGTPDYTAPEMINGKTKGYTITVDWWAFGILLFEMLTG